MYDETTDNYICPQGQVLITNGSWYMELTGSGTVILFKQYKTKACKLIGSERNLISLRKADLQTIPKNKFWNNQSRCLMANYRISNAAKEDLIRFHHYGVEKSGISQADKYFDMLFEYINIIAQRPFAFESVDYIKKGYRFCVCGSDSIYYRLNSDIVEIMAIIGRQDVNNIL